VVGQLGRAGDVINWLLRNACLAAMVLGIVAAARDEDDRRTGLIAFGLGILAYITWAVIRVLEKKLFGLEA
jgi:hypothetical protein